MGGNESLQAVFILGSEPATVTLREPPAPLTGRPLADDVQPDGIRLSLPAIGVFIGKPADDGPAP